MFKKLRNAQFKVWKCIRSFWKANFYIRINLLFYLFSTVLPFNSCVFIFCRPFVVNTTFSTGLVSFEVSSFSWLGQKTGDRRNFNTHKTCWKCINDERPTEKKHTTVGWDDSGNIGKIIISYLNPTERHIYLRTCFWAMSVFSFTLTDLVDHMVAVKHTL